MAAAETARLIASLELKDNLSKGVKSATASLGKLDTSLGKIGGMAQKGLGTAARNLAKIGAVAAVGVGAMVKSGIESLSRIESINAQTAAAIESTGGAANVSAAEIAALAESIENLTTTEAESVQEAANLLLTFTQVKNQVGEGNDIFNQATEAITDMSVALGQDMTSSAMQLGKALNDPVRGMATLRRSGIQFTSDQEKLIKTLVESGDTMGAQKVMLEELNRQFGGSAAAQADTYGGKIRALGHAWGTVQETLAEGLVPVLGEVATELQKVFKDKAVMNGVKEFGVTLAEGFRSLVGIAKNLPWAQIGESLKLAGTGARMVLDAFVALPPWVQTAVLTGWGLNKLTGGALGGIVGELGKGLIKGVLGMNAAVVNLRAAAVNGLGGIGGGKGGAVAPTGGVAGRAAGIGSAIMKVAVVGMAAGVAVALAQELATQSEELRQKGTELLGQGRQFKGEASNKDLIAAINNIEGQWEDPLNALALAITNPLNGANDKLTTLRNELRAQLSENANAGRASFEALYGRVDNLSTATGFKLEAVKNATATGLSATTAAAKGTTSALNAKDMSPKVSVSTNVSTVVSVRAVTNGQTVVSAYNNRGTTNTWGGGR